MSNLRMAIVGTGRIGNRHAEHISNMAILAAVCDIREDAAGEVAKKYGCKHFQNVEDMHSKCITR